LALMMSHFFRLPVPCERDTNAADEPLN
jgi:hypothetical protein